MTKLFTPRIIFISVAILLAAFSRLIPHPFGFTAIGAMALFGGSMLKDKRLGFFIPLAALWIGDVILDNTVYSQYFEGFVLLRPSFYWVWGTFALVTVLGMFLIKKLNLLNVATASVISATLFFLVTNFGAWMGSPLYPQNFAGLTEAYIAGLPFYRNDLVGTLFYSGVLFGTFYYAQQRYPRLLEAKA